MTTRKSPNSLAVVALTLTSTLVLAACGGSSGGGDPAGTDPADPLDPLSEPSATLDAGDNAPSADCGSDFESAIDPDSSTALWSDNCTLREGGAFATSAYTLGVQRILFCAGFSDDLLESEFVDGVYGPTTTEAVRAFQEERTDSSLGRDGIVGPQTWAALNTELDEAGTTTDDGFAAFRVDGGACPEIQFYQELVPAGDSSVASGWSMALTPGSLQRTTFSTARPNPGSR